MKASDLIARLEQAMAEHGDLVVRLWPSNQDWLDGVSGVRAGPLMDLKSPRDSIIIEGGDLVSASAQTEDP